METSGILLIDKPAGPSSAHVLRLISRQLGLPKQLKIGHAGTLDPFATGLLVVLLGKACRLADFFQVGEKVYSGHIQLGTSTDSHDITGQVISSSDDLPDYGQVEQSAKTFLGQIEQMPPSISALKIGGKRAYQVKRSGIEPELKARSVRLASIEVQPVNQSIIAFKISCSKGFYVRSLARDIGQKLGCGACLKSLRREASSPFLVSDAITVEEIGEVKKYPFISLDAALELLGFNEILVTEKEFKNLRNGLIPSSLLASLNQKLDSAGQGLIVYKSNSDRQAGGLLNLSETEFSISMNF